MQNPPRPPDRPGYLQIDTALEIKSVAPDPMRPGPRTSNDNRAGPFGHGVPVYYQNLQTIRTTTQALDQDYQNRLVQLTQAIEVDLWNNAHTATLEDFKLRDDESLLYTKEAIAAADKQDEVFFKNQLKGGKS